MIARGIDSLRTFTVSPGDPEVLNKEAVGIVILFRVMANP